MSIFIIFMQKICSYIVLTLFLPPLRNSKASLSNVCSRQILFDNWFAARATPTSSPLMKTFISSPSESDTDGSVLNLKHVFGGQSFSLQFSV